jgi:hypothetical protein
MDQSQKLELVRVLLEQYQSEAQTSVDRYIWNSLYAHFNIVREQGDTMNINQLAEDDYKREVSDIIFNDGTALQIADCLKKHFVQTDYFIKQLQIQRTENNLMLSPLGNPDAGEIKEALRIDNILTEVNAKIETVYDQMQNIRRTSINNALRIMERCFDEAEKCKI